MRKFAVGCAALALVMLGTAAPAQEISSRIDAVLANPDQLRKSYAGPDAAAVLQSLEASPETAIPELVQSLAANQSAPAFAVTIDLVRSTKSLTPQQVIDHAIETWDGVDEPQFKAISALALSIAPHGQGESQYNIYASVLGGESETPQSRSIIRWMIHKEPLAAIHDVSIYVLGQNALFQRHREVSVMARDIQDSVWREVRGIGPDDELSPAATLALDSMIAADEWWVRLAAAEVITALPYTATPERLALLCADADPTVSARVQTLCQP